MNKPQELLLKRIQESIKKHNLNFSFDSWKNQVVSKKIEDKQLQTFIGNERYLSGREGLYVNYLYSLIETFTTIEFPHHTQEEQDQYDNELLTKEA
jgi:hypothetical protein